MGSQFFAKRYFNGFNNIRSNTQKVDNSVTNILLSLEKEIAKHQRGRCVLYLCLDCPLFCILCYVACLCFFCPSLVISLERQISLVAGCLWHYFITTLIIQNIKSLQGTIVGKTIGKNVKKLGLCFAILRVGWLVLKISFEYYCFLVYFKLN